MDANMKEQHQQQAVVPTAAPVAAVANYKGFVAGVFSGIAKLSGASDFLDTLSTTMTGLFATLVHHLPRR